MLREQKNSRKQGDVGLGVAIGWFTQNGYTVCVPLTDSQDYDLVVEADDGLKKIQVKTTYCKSAEGVFKATIRTSGGNKTGTKVKKFNPESVDFLFVLTEDGDGYLIPSGSIRSRNTVNLGSERKKYRVMGAHKSCGETS